MGMSCLLTTGASAAAPSATNAPGPRALAPAVPFDLSFHPAFHGGFGNGLHGCQVVVGLDSVFLPLVIGVVGGDDEVLSSRVKVGEHTPVDLHRDCVLDCLNRDVPSFPVLDLFKQCAHLSSDSYVRNVVQVVI